MAAPQRHGHDGAAQHGAAHDGTAQDGTAHDRATDAEFPAPLPWLAGGKVGPVAALDAAPKSDPRGYGAAFGAAPSERGAARSASAEYCTGLSSLPEATPC